MTDTILHDYCRSDGESNCAVCQGKFLQLLLDRRDYLVFSPGSLYRYHNQMLARFLADKRVACHWASEERLEHDTSRLEVLGGGRFRVDRDARTLDLWDDSHVYGRFHHQGLAESIARAGHRWSGYTVRIL